MLKRSIRKLIALILAIAFGLWLLSYLNAENQQMAGVKPGFEFSSACDLTRHHSLSTQKFHFVR